MEESKKAISDMQFDPAGDPLKDIKEIRNAAKNTIDIMKLMEEDAQRKARRALPSIPEETKEELRAAREVQLAKSVSTKKSVVAKRVGVPGIRRGATAEERKREQARVKQEKLKQEKKREQERLKQVRARKERAERMRKQQEALAERKRLAEVKKREEARKAREARVKKEKEAAARKAKKAAVLVAKPKVSAVRRAQVAQAREEIEALLAEAGLNYPRELVNRFVQFQKRMHRSRLASSVMAQFIDQELMRDKNGKRINKTLTYKQVSLTVLYVIVAFVHKKYDSQAKEALNYLCNSKQGTGFEGHPTLKVYCIALREYIAANTRARKK